MRWRNAAILLCLLAGCGARTSPATGRFSPGDEAILYAESRDEVLVGYRMYPAGTRVTVVSDETQGGDKREVMVNCQGYAGTAYRDDLRPAPR